MQYLSVMHWCHILESYSSYMYNDIKQTHLLLIILLQGNLERCLPPYHLQSSQQSTAFYLDLSVGFLRSSLCTMLSSSIYITTEPSSLVPTAAVGLSFLQFTNMNSMRNLFIVGVSIFLGLSIPQYFFSYSTSAGHGPAHTKAGWVSSSPHVVLHSRYVLNYSALLTWPPHHSYIAV